MLFSFLSYFFPSENKKYTNVSAQEKNPNSQKVLEDAIFGTHGVLLQDFTLFHRTTALSIDLLIFLPHYGLYLGEKIAWKRSELKGASIERSSQKNKKISTSNLESTQKILQQKLEDVLSFDSTQIERFFWMEHLSEAEFDGLDSSFHKLLPKKRLLFSDDSIQNIQDKLTSLGTYQETPYSKLKVIGSLSAHTLLLPTTAEPFGAFLNKEQQTFLDAPLTQSTLILGGEYASGRSTVIVRKILQILLNNSYAKIIIITPTLLNGETLRQELIMLADFAVVYLDSSRLQFLSPSKLYSSIHPDMLPSDFSHIVCDDIQLLDMTSFLTSTNVKGKSIILSGPIRDEDTAHYILKQPYRKPNIHSIHFSHTKGALYALLSGLRNHLELLSSSPVMIILPNETLLDEYKNAIDEYLHLESRILKTSFSLQYKSLESITLSTLELISALSVSHCYLINLDPNHPLYPLALSRASESVTIISEDLH
ncbi:MAG: hypothetical protein PHQ22_04215 [Sulfuricurvum sp.]|nr:hypothetical protein [Sulfuricurvum sp.]MDD5386382.1 hypothetical protein [Sulfuricurvum sp.]